MKKLICFAGAAGGLLLAIVGMFSFSLWQIVCGLALYIASSYVWERSISRRAANR